MNTRDTDNQLRRLAIASVTLSPCPNPDQLAAFALNQLQGSEQLAVDAHVRRCPLCAGDLELARPDDLRAVWPVGLRPPSRRRSILASLVAAPLPVAGLRGELAEAPRRYEAATIGVELTIRQEGDFRRLTGQVLRGQEGLASCQVTLRAGRQRQAQLSDADGYFTFEDLAPGHYSLIMDDGRIKVEIADLDLTVDVG